MSELLNNKTLIVFGFLTLVCVVPVIAHHWYQIRVKEWEISLKHSMLERGMSAEEIKTVLEASTMEPGRKCGTMASKCGTGSTYSESANTYS